MTTAARSAIWIRKRGGRRPVRRELSARSNRHGPPPGRPDGLARRRTPWSPTGAAHSLLRHLGLKTRDSTDWVTEGPVYLGSPDLWPRPRLLAVAPLGSPPERLARCRLRPRRRVLATLVLRPALWSAPGTAPARPKMRRIAPQRAAAVPWHRPGRARRTLPRRRLGLPAGMLLSSIVRSGRSARHDQPDLLRRLQESPAKTRHVPVPSAGVKGVGKGTSFLVRALRIRLSARLQQVMPATPPCAGADSWLAERDIVPLRCCILLLYKARELWAQDFEFISLTWVELRGFEPLTSCMPSAGSTSTAVRLCRSPSQEVRTRPVKSAPVAVLSCCTGQPARPGPQ